MVIANGTIQIKIQTGGGMLHGIPQPIKTSWSEPIPANISKSRDDRRGTYIGILSKFITNCLSVR